MLRRLGIGLASMVLLGAAASVSPVPPNAETIFVRARDAAAKPCSARFDYHDYGRHSIYRDTALTFHYDAAPVMHEAAFAFRRPVAGDDLVEPSE